MIDLPIDSKTPVEKKTEAVAKAELVITEGLAEFKAGGYQQINNRIDINGTQYKLRIWMDGDEIQLKFYKR